MINLIKSGKVIPIGPEILSLNSIVSSLQLLSEESVYYVIYTALDRLYKNTIDEQASNDQIIQQIFNTRTLISNLLQYHNVCEIKYIWEQFNLITQTYTTNAA